MISLKTLDYRIYSPDCRNPYEKLNKLREKVLSCLIEEKDLHDQTVIFEQEMPEFKITKQIQKEMQLLKAVWDYVHVIDTSLNEWKKTTWKKLDIEWMDQECKKLVRELRRKKILSSFISSFLSLIKFTIHNSQFMNIIIYNI